MAAAPPVCKPHDTSGRRKGRNIRMIMSGEPTDCLDMTTRTSRQCRDLAPFRRQINTCHLDGLAVRYAEFHSPPAPSASPTCETVRIDIASVFPALLFRLRNTPPARPGSSGRVSAFVATFAAVRQKKTDIAYNKRCWPEWTLSGHDKIVYAADGARMFPGSAITYWSGTLY